MQVKQRMIMNNILFEDYLEMEGWSYSSIKNEGVPFNPPTAKMQLGTHVHNYLLTPEEYSFDDIAIVKPLATVIAQRIGVLMRYLRPELAVQATFSHAGFDMKYKGRLDLCIPDRIVIDLKVSEQPLPVGIKYFGYDKQLSGYAMAIGAKAALIVGIHPKTKKITTYNIPIDAAWWEYEILKRGEPVL